MPAIREMLSFSYLPDQLVGGWSSDENKCVLSGVERHVGNISGKA